MRVLTAWLGRAGVAAPWALVALMAWTDRPYALDLASHFLLHASAALVVMGAGLFAARRRIGGASAAMAGLVIAGGWWFGASVPVGSGGKGATARLRVVFYNAHAEASRHDNEAMRWILEQKPDVILLLEPPWDVLDDYPVLRRQFPGVVSPEAGLLWPVIMLSRFPARIEPLEAYSEATKFSFVARRSLLVEHPSGARFLVSALHPTSPRTKATWARSLAGVVRDGGVIRSWAARSGLPIIVAGDFNSTPVGRVHRTFARTSGLRAWSPMVRAGTWPAWLSPWVSLPIDRVWTGGGAIVRSVRVGPRFRSDHRPVVAEIDVPAAAGRTNGAAQTEQTPAGAVERE